MPPRKRGLNQLKWKEKKTGPMPEQVKVEEERETKDGKDTNEEKETKREKDRIYAEFLSKPPHGSEVFIGDIPPDTTEEELKEFCKDAGEVVEVRMVRKNDDTRVCALVSFRTVEMASEAIKELHDSEFKEKKVSCSRSYAKNTIFVKNIPYHWGESELENALNKVGPGVICVLVMKDSLTGQARRFGYVAYYNGACAYYSLQEMSKLDFKLGTNSPTVKWVKTWVKEVYVKNLPMDVTEKQIKELFERHGDIKKVMLPRPKAEHEKRYAFVHFRECADGMKALQKTER